MKEERIIFWKNKNDLGIPGFPAKKKERATMGKGGGQRGSDKRLVGGDKFSE